MRPKVLVVDGYSKSARDELVAGGATIAASQYVQMLEKICPGIHCDIIFPSDPGVKIPHGKALSDYDGIAWTGCSLAVFEDVPEVKVQIEFARECFEAGVPGFGSCWAAQIAIVAAGGSCKPNPNGREMGIARKITLTPEGRGHLMYTGKNAVFDAFISHLDEITHVPSGSVVLAGNTFTRVQSVSVSFKKGKFWGLQYHPEYNLREIARLTWCRIDKLSKLGFFNNREAGEEYVSILETLHKDPGRKDLAWLLGIDDDVMKEDIRRLEVYNWIQNLVLPTMILKGRTG